MKQILFVSCNRWSYISQSDTVLADALRARGYGVDHQPWLGGKFLLGAAAMV